MARGKLFLLQARPITTLTVGNLETYDINYSCAEDAVWTNTNVAEAIPDVFSPLTWSIGRQLDAELNFIPGYYVWSGNICGRAYMNISRRVSVISSVLGKDARSALKLLGFYGHLPEAMSMPLYPFSRLQVFKEMIPRMLHVATKTLTASRQLPQFLQATPQWCRMTTTRLYNITTKQELLSFWKETVQPAVLKAW